VAVWMCLAVSSVGLYADWQRRTAISKFHPDSEIQHSFFRSIRGSEGVTVLCSRRRIEGLHSLHLELSQYELGPT